MKKSLLVNRCAWQVIIGVSLISLVIGGCRAVTPPLDTAESLPPTVRLPEITPTVIKIQTAAPSSTFTATASKTPTAIDTATPIPPPGQGWIELPTAATDDPPIRSYVCPWLEMPGDQPHYGYQVLNTYPHDPQAYTQGLFFENGTLYESTGRKGTSSLRKVDLESGKVLMKVDIPEAYYAEGATQLDGRIFQLTWKEQTGFIYEPDRFELVGTFSYQTEGWGLTQDGEFLIRSDGTSMLAFIDPQTLGVVKAIPVSTGSQEVQKLNELEYIDGEIWANVYLTSCVARIDPLKGQVIGWIDLSGLLGIEELEFADVPNGIAYDEQTGRIFVTGKYWPKLFEIKVVSSAAK